MDKSTLQSITNPKFMAMIPQFMKSLSCLTHSGEHFEAWSNQLKLMVHNLTGIPNYLDQHSSPNIDKKVDRLVLSMILWSIDETLQTTVNISSTAYEAFCSLTQQFSRPHHRSEPISLSDDRQNPGQSDSSGNFEHIVNNIHPKLLGSISARPADRTSKTCFLSLPNNILDRIVQFVRMVAATEIETKTNQRWSRIIKLNCDNISQYFGTNSYYSEPFCAWFDPPSQNVTPILNSFQSLAVVNRRLHKLCLPWLWKELVFPTSMPRLPATYIEDVCPKYSHLIKSVTAELSIAWGQESPVAAWSRTDVTDNLIVLHDDYDDDSDSDEDIGPRDRLPRDYYGAQRGLSPGNLNKIVVQCPNLRTLKLIMPNTEEWDEPDEPPRLEMRILDLVTNFNQLRHLELQDPTGWELSEIYVLKMVEQLPLLETFSCEALTPPPRSTGELKWGQTMSQLKNLTRLSLEQVHFVGPSFYIAHTWPQIITHLTLKACHKLSIHEVHQLVHIIAPHVTNLGINVIRRVKKDSANPTKSQCDTFNLPQLKQLDLMIGSKPELIHAFRKCKKLEHLTYRSFPSHCWYRFTYMVFTSTWPELKFIALPDMGGYDYADCRLVKVQHAFRKYCRQNVITLDAAFI